MRSTWVKPASRRPSSKMAARIGLSSTMAIFSVESRCAPGDGAPWPEESEPFRVSANSSDLAGTSDSRAAESTAIPSCILLMQDPFQPNKAGSAGPGASKRRVHLMQVGHGHRSMRTTFARD